MKQTKINLWQIIYRILSNKRPGAYKYFLEIRKARRKELIGEGRLLEMVSARQPNIACSHGF